LNLIPVTQNANEIRERILELRLEKSVTPTGEPLRQEYFKSRHYIN